MAVEDIHAAIADGIALAYRHPDQFGMPLVPRVGQHPNATMQLAAMNGFTIGRQTMDPTLGEKGFVHFRVNAVDGPTARRMVDDLVGDINAPFREKAGLTGRRPERGDKDS